MNYTRRGGPYATAAKQNKQNDQTQQSSQHNQNKQSNQNYTGDYGVAGQRFSLLRGIGILPGFFGACSYKSIWAPFKSPGQDDGQW